MSSVAPAGPWTAYHVDLTPHMPSMLGGEERQFLYWFGRDQYRGEGEMVDLGGFLGASSAAMAAGLMANPRVKDVLQRIHSYDFWDYIGSFYGPMLPDEDLQEGEDVLPIFWRHLGGLAPQVEAVKGDITAATFDKPIELLFVDFTQRWAHHQAVIETFYPHLQVGGVLVHQDYNYVLCYWLHVFMEYYWDHFELLSLHIREGSAAWRLVKPLPEEAFTTPLQTILDTDQMLALIDRSHARYADWQEPVYRTLLACQRARFFLHALGRDAARAEAAKIEDLHPALQQLRDEIEIFDTNAYAGFFKAPPAAQPPEAETA